MTDKTERGNAPNKEAKSLTQKALDALSAHPLTIPFRALFAKDGDKFAVYALKKEAGEIDSEEKTILENLNSEKAKIIVHDKGKGATIISSSGSITSISDNPELFNEAPPEPMKRLHDKVAEAFKNDGLIDVKEKISLEQLDKILPGVAMVVLADNKSAILVDNNGATWPVGGNELYEETLWDQLKNEHNATKTLEIATKIKALREK